MDKMVGHNHVCDPIVGSGAVAVNVLYLELKDTNWDTLSNRSIKILTL